MGKWWLRLLALRMESCLGPAGRGQRGEAPAGALLSPSGFPVPSRLSFWCDSRLRGPTNLPDISAVGEGQVRGCSPSSGSPAPETQVRAFTGMSMGQWPWNVLADQAVTRSGFVVSDESPGSGLPASGSCPGQLRPPDKHLRPGSLNSRLCFLSLEAGSPRSRRRPGCPETSLFGLYPHRVVLCVCL